MKKAMDFTESYQQFLFLLESPKIKHFLKRDKCKIIADNYLIATVFVFFRRANLRKKEYTNRNFYLALYLAHDLEEDIDDFKDDIVAHYLGHRKCYIRSYYEGFLKDRFRLFQRMGFDATVTKEMCKRIMAKHQHWAWTRTRNELHSGVFYKHYICPICCIEE